MTEVDVADLGGMFLALWAMMVLLAFVFSYILNYFAPHLVFRECFTVTECLPDLVTRI